MPIPPQPLSENIPISAFPGSSPKKSRFWLFIPLLILVISALAAFAYQTYHLKQQLAQTKTLPSPTIVSPLPAHGLGALPSFPEKKDICGVAINYTTSIKKINGSESGNKALQEYVAYMKKNNLEDSNGAVDWQFKGVQPGVSYQGKIYWLVNFHYFTKNDKLKGGNAQLYISEDGEIVSLLGCP